MIIKELTVSYSAGMKASLPHNKFENAQIQISRTELIHVENDEDPDAIFQQRYAAMQKEVGDLVVVKYDAIKNGEL